MRLSLTCGFSLLCLVAALVDCGGGGSPSSTSAVPNPVTPSGHASHQYVIGIFLAQAIAQSPATHILDGTRPYVIIDAVATTPSSAFDYTAVPAAWQAIPMVRYASEADLAADIAQQPSTVKVEMFDLEPNQSPTSPPDEIADPATYETLASELAHASGRLYYPTAGLNVPQQSQNVINTAGGWDAYGIQTQTGEYDITSFTNEITNVGAEIHAVNPKVVLGAGIGDYTNGTLATIAQMTTAAAVVPANYPLWLNFGPHPGIPGRPDLAIQFIEASIASN